jgi:hypothetical protein
VKCVILDSPNGLSVSCDGRRFELVTNLGEDIRVQSQGQHVHIEIIDAW